MHLEVNMPQNGRNKKARIKQAFRNKQAFRDKQATSKVLLLFLGVKMLIERYDQPFLDAVNQEARYDSCI